jgi:hypothetical protein
MHIAPHPAPAAVYVVVWAQPPVVVHIVMSLLLGLAPADSAALFFCRFY